MVNFYFAAQILGILSFLLGVYAYYQKDDTKLKIYITLMFIAHGAHFYLLGAQVAALLCIISVLRTVLSIFYHSVYLALVFIAITLLTGYLSYESYFDIIVIIASVIGIYSFICLQGIKLRIFILIGSTLWLINNILVGSIGGTLMELFVISTNLLTMYRIQSDIKEKAKAPSP